jgi:hypothetical protein
MDSKPSLKTRLQQPGMIVAPGLNVMGISAAPGTTDQFGEEIKRDLARYGQVVKAAGIKAE